MRKLIILMLMLPIMGFSQEKEFVSVSVETDVGNLLQMGSSPRGFNAVAKLNYRVKDVQVGVFYETFPNMKYQSVGIGINYVFNHEHRWNFLAGLEASRIWRDVKSHSITHEPSFAFNTQIEYHINRTLYLIGRNEIRYRGDLKVMYDDADLIVNSSFIGIGIKFN